MQIIGASVVRDVGCNFVVNRESEKVLKILDYFGKISRGHMHSKSDTSLCLTF